MASGAKSQQNFNQGIFSGLLDLTDAKIVADDGCSFDVHKVILAVRCDYFRAMFTGMDSDKKEYRISNINGNCMSEILSYIYTNDICVTEININYLLSAADYFLLKELYTKLKKMVKTNFTDANCLKLCLTAYQLNESEMLQQCFIYIQRRFQMIILRQKDDLADLPQDVLKNILSERNLNVECERTVWQAIIYWTQADIKSRLNSVQNLLLTLAIDEIDENLASEIINQDIVFNNVYMKPLLEIESFDDFGSDCARLKYCLRKHLKDFQIQNFRIPQKLNVVFKYIREEEICEIYISYDETLDLWRKIAELDFDPQYVIAIGWNIFVFEEKGPRCVAFNLITKESKPIPMQNINYFDRIALAIENSLYIINAKNVTYGIDVYNAAINRWNRFGLLYRTSYCSAAAVRKNIFIVGVPCRNGMTSLIFNSVTQKWKFFEKPNIIRDGFELVAYHEKLYIIGGFNEDNERISDVEVFDCSKTIWKELPTLPCTHQRSAVIILNDQMIFYDMIPLEDDKSYLNPVRWDDVEECWKILDKSNLPKGFHRFRRKIPSSLGKFRYCLCTVDDTETIRVLTKQNRNPEVQMKKSI